MKRTLSEIEKINKSLMEEDLDLSTEIDILERNLLNLRRIRSGVKRKIKENEKVIKLKLFNSIQDFKIGDKITFNLNCIHPFRFSNNFNKSLIPLNTIEIIKVNKKSVVVKYNGSDYISNEDRFIDDEYTLNITKERLKRLVSSYTDGIRDIVRRDEEIEKIMDI